MRHILFFIFFAALSPRVIANSFLDIAVSATHFDYQERSSTGAKLNNENGVIPGILARYGYIYKKLGLNLTAEHHNGNVDYQGVTQTGIPLNSNTDEQFTDLAAELIWQPFSFNLGVYTQFKWLEWQRHIQATSQTLALNETYQWQNIEAGFVSPILQYGKHKLALKLGLTHSNNGQLKVDLSSLGYGKPTLDLGDGSGFSINLSYHMELSNSNKLILGLTHKQWDFTRGHSKSVANQSNSITISEPASDSKTTSIFLSYRFNLDNIFSTN